MYTVHVYPPDQQNPTVENISSFRDLKRLIRGESQTIDNALVEFRVIGETVLVFNEEGQIIDLPQNEAFPITYSAPRDPNAIMLGDQIPYLLGTVVMMTRRDFYKVAG